MNELSARGQTLALAPHLKNAVWGGTRLKSMFDTDMPNIAEAWLLSDRENAESTVTNGVFSGMPLSYALKALDIPPLPVLVKLIDAKLPLSVQVHPDDEYAKAKGMPRGKSEMWCVIDAEPGAFIYYGLNRAVSREDLAEAARDGTIVSILRKVYARPGDVFYIPAGTVHAIGAGILIAEIQQSSDTTYRLYDYGRRDNNGNTRQLHLDDAVRCVSVSECTQKPLALSQSGGFVYEFEDFSVSGAVSGEKIAVTVKCGACEYTLRLTENR